ncbi:MAG TPA: hypothetical protein VM680_02945 [Verrucomicrobiae bacterium]|nr:hypothetical protein [Verrucomicrobiae bacterium]
MNTEKYFRVAAACAGLAFAMIFTGCGGGDSAGGGGQVAPESLQGRSYNFSPNTGGQTAVSFTSPTDYTFLHETGAVEQGNYEAARDGNTWTTTLINTNGGQQVYTMTFGSENGGTFVLRREGEDDRFGPFSARDSAIPSGDVEPGGTTTAPTTTGPGDGEVTPSDQYTGNAPVSIAGRTMQGTRTFTSTGPNGQTHTYTFGNGTFHDEDGPEQADGTFVYNANKSHATLTLNYNSPGFVGDKHDLTMNFTQKDRGTFQSTYTRGDGTTIIINGEFNFEPIP